MSPREIITLKGREIPPYVFTAFNVMLARKFTCGVAIFKAIDVVAEIIAEATEKGVTVERIYRDGWLNVKAVYETKGWRVQYHDEGYSVHSRFIFTAETEHV